MTLGRMTAVALAGLMAMTSACKSAEEKAEVKSNKAISGLHKTRGEMIAMRRDVERAMSDLEALQNERRDVRPPFERIKDDAKAVESSFKKVNESADDMQDDATEFRREWMESTATLGDPDLRASAEQRNQQIRDQYQSINDKAFEARQAYDPFIRRLRELESYLAHDLTPEAVGQAQGTVDRAQSDGQALIERLDGVVAEIEDLVLMMNEHANGH
jgi:chromosome segregation ATPase